MLHRLFRTRFAPQARPMLALVIGVALLAGCSSHKSVSATSTTTSTATSPRGSNSTPTNADPKNIYAATGAGMIDAKLEGEPALVYVPNTESNSVSVIDPATYKVIRTIPVGRQPQHVSPSWDLSVLWVEDDLANDLTPIDPRTGRAGTPVPVEDPYNLYFTPDGTRAAVMAEAQRRMDFRDAHTMAIRHRMPVPCNGLNHMDFAPDGRTAVASCEFDGSLLHIDMTPGAEKVLAQINVGGMPQDVKLSPDGSTYYVADIAKHGIHIIDGAAFKEIGFLPTGRGAHGLYPSRDGTKLYISNRGEGSVSVMDFASRRLIAKWVFNGGRGSPDMGGVSADGKVLWLSGRYDSEVYAINTETGKLVVPPIKVGKGPHGASVWPQPGRYSMGHTGNMR